MMKTFFKIAAMLVGANLLLVLALFVTEATHGINDQDASFALAMLVYTLNKPAIWAFEPLGITSEAWTLLAGGTLQWGLVSAVITLISGFARSRRSISTDNPV